MKIVRKIVSLLVPLVLVGSLSIGVTSCGQSQVGRYQMVPLEQGAVYLLDTSTGDYYLVAGENIIRGPVHLPKAPDSSKGQ